jgi:hypothetical protein
MKGCRHTNGKNRADYAAFDRNVPCADRKHGILPETPHNGEVIRENRTVRDHGGYCGTSHSKSENKNEQGIEQDVEHSSKGHSNACLL